MEKDKWINGIGKGKYFLFRYAGNQHYCCMQALLLYSMTVFFSLFHAFYAERIVLSSIHMKAVEMQLVVVR